jgi:hypothetical protein
MDRTKEFMKNVKMVGIQLDTAKQLVRLLRRLEAMSCIGCEGELHTDDCRAQEVYQVINYLNLRVNNPNRNFTV